MTALLARELQLYAAVLVFGGRAQLLAAALDLHQSAQLSFWDAMVVQAALEAGCDKLYSEDLNPGQRFGSLVVVNPFKQRCWVSLTAHGFSGERPPSPK